jgi:hypothetical protein
MTETEWLECADPSRLIDIHIGKTSDRKLRLCACGWLRLSWHLLSEAQSRMSVKMTEMFAAPKRSRR